LNRGDLSLSREGILSVCWRNTQNINSADFINVSNKLLETKRFAYTGSVPTYRQIDETASLNIVLNWLKKFYIYIPSYIDTIPFVNSLLKYITTECYISTEEFGNRIPVGGAFNNVFAQLIQKNPHVLEVPYGPGLFVDREPINHSYSPPNFRNGNLVINQDTLKKIFL